jgi:hypothetical protein
MSGFFGCTPAPTVTTAGGTKSGNPTAGTSSGSQPPSIGSTYFSCHDAASG